ncbi:MAG: histidine phosphatase family protein, partial [Pseudomonadota bacterium]
PGGEGLRAVQDRLRGVLAVLTGPAILVTHGVLSIALRAQLRGIGHEDWDALTDPQGVVHHVVGGQEKLLR